MTKPLQINGALHFNIEIWHWHLTLQNKLVNNLKSATLQGFKHLKKNHKNIVTQEHPNQTLFF